jgi:signal transduction histidine kinase/HAMP domain-containing protein
MSRLGSPAGASRPPPSAVDARARWGPARAPGAGRAGPADGPPGAAVKLSLTTKIILAFAVTLGSIALFAIFTVREFHAVGEDLRSINDGHLVLTRLAGQLETHQQNRFRDLRRGLEDTDPASREVVLRIAAAYFPDVVRSRIGEVREVCGRQLRLVEPPRTSEDRTKRDFYRAIRDRTEVIGRLHAGTDALTERMLARLRAGESVAELASEIDALESDLRGEIYQLNKRIHDETDRAVRRAERDERNAIFRVVAMTVTALLVGLLLTLLSARALAPITELVRFARAISRGDYSHRARTRGDDELSALAEELTLMAKNRKDREEALDRQQEELERAYHRVADLKRYHESVVESLRTAVIVTDRDLIVTGANRATGVVLELDPAEVRGRRLPELALGEILVAAIGPLEQVLGGSEAQLASDLAIGERRLDATVAPFLGERGAVLGLVVAVEDVTEAARTKEALIRSERLAAIGRMSAHVTHEIRNPLSSIGLNAELLEQIVTGPESESVRPEEAHELAVAITREVDRLTAITDEYLRFARLPRPRLVPHALPRLLADVASFVRADLHAARVEVVVEPCEPPPPEVAIDVDQLRQAVLNLVRNAKESMPEGGRVTLRVERTSDEVAIAVVDTGVGIPAESLDRIFDPFYSTKLTGTGLGLALVQQIVTEHGGRLDVRSTPGEGTSFRIVLPPAPPAGEPPRPSLLSAVEE